MIRKIKQELRLAMNGVASTQMREAGLQYHVNFGVELPRLKQMAEEFGQDADVASQLWREDVRESKILACMMMPTEVFGADLCDLWVSQMPNAEIAEMASLLLFSRLPYALAASFVWMASDVPLRQVCGFMTIAHLVRRGVVLAPREAKEMCDQCHAGLLQAEDAVKMAARRALAAYENTGCVQ